MSDSKDPFNIKSVIHRTDKPAPSPNEYTFYYYYHRPTQAMIVRLYSRAKPERALVCESINTLGLDTYTLRHVKAPLRYLVSGICKRFEYDERTRTITLHNT